MKDDDKNIDITDPKNQLNLFGYQDYFNSFIKLYKKNKLPNVILLSGPKGIGKATFAYHFINYLLSNNEENKYLINDFKINKKNVSYKLMSNKTHPNFFLLQNNLFAEDIKIDQVRSLLRFLSKSTFSRNIKIVMIDNAEYLNLNSSNALLKALEEPNNSTFFFIIQNSSSKILNTIKSRCIEFKFFFNTEQKRQIFTNINQEYKLDFNLENFHDNFYFDTPGNLLRYSAYFTSESNDEYLKIISLFIQKYLKGKNSEDLTLISLLIETFYNKLLISYPYNKFKLFFDRSNILNKINLFRKFNLDSKDTFFNIENILKDETR